MLVRQRKEKALITAHSVWFYVIPWESRVNSCHLRFSCSEVYADLKK